MSERISEERLSHARNCPAWKDMHGYDVNGEDCTCGLRWRIEIQTLQTLRAAWEKRAYESEAELLALRAAAEEMEKALAGYPKFPEDGPNGCKHDNEAWYCDGCQLDHEEAVKQWHLERLTVLAAYRKAVGK